ncbi:Nuclear receptor coactivator 5 [Cichlidogyrus casuarinus]|uniref:Nuclear receptor coactivator 5 n=1 Tax=Cichlidogyrus casuarinus TaxID=1844966 RepID=A0ABD2QGL1_9PLAT
MSMPVASEIVLPPYEVAIIALNHELISYAQHLREKISNMTGMPGNSVLLRAPTTHIIVLKEVEHVVPCLEDLTTNNIYFAIILNELNLSHSSCTVFILHTPPQQEHRNMPLHDALVLLRKSFDDFLDLNPAILSKLLAQFTPKLDPVVVPVKQEADIDDSVVRTPPLLVNLFKLVAESRFLSIGELDQLMDFIELRRAKLGAPKRLQPPQTESSDLKNKILDMLYPDKQPTETKTSAASVNVTEMVKNSLSSPSVQKAVNSLINCATSTAAAPAIAVPAVAAPVVAAPVAAAPVVAAPAVAVCAPIVTTPSKPVAMTLPPVAPVVSAPTAMPVQSYMSPPVLRPMPVASTPSVPPPPMNTAIKTVNPSPRYMPPRYPPPSRPIMSQQPPNYFPPVPVDHHHQQQQQQSMPGNTQQPMGSYYNGSNQVNHMSQSNYNYGAPQPYNNMPQQRPPYRPMY